MEKTLTQREFAEITGASTATVSAMLKAGVLRKTPDGRIPQGEVEHYFEKEIKKYSGNGTYLLSTADTEEEVLRIKENIEKSMEVAQGAALFYAPSIAYIMDAASPCRSGKTGTGGEYQ